RYGYRPDGLLEWASTQSILRTNFADYDANGNPTEVRLVDNFLGIRKTTFMHYDARNRLDAKTIRVAGQPDIVTTYKYDANDNPTSVIDPEQHETKYEFDYNHQAT